MKSINKRLLLSWLIVVLFCLIANFGLAQTPTPPGFTLTASPGSATANAGTNVTFVITVVPANGFSDNVQFTCSQSIPASACSFNPSTLVVNNASASTSMTLATNFVAAGGATFGKARPSQAPLSHPNKTLYAMLSLGGAGIFGLVLPASRSQNKRKRRAAAAIMGLVLFITLMALQGCGGIKERTPPGTYMLTVTGSSTTVNPAQSGTVILTVNIN
ncbi:MAG TPA: hypothetical protein VK699_17320 [Terriglobales bacterium]|jgi:hypothetical protein|nr:hypothetical protein [Terriglobales bacterium]